MQALLFPTRAVYQLDRIWTPVTTTWTLVHFNGKASAHNILELSATNLTDNTPATFSVALVPSYSSNSGIPGTILNNLFINQQQVLGTETYRHPIRLVAAGMDSVWIRTLTGNRLLQFYAEINVEE